MAFQYFNYTFSQPQTEDPYQASICLTQGTTKPLVAGSNPAIASFYIRGPEPKGWHLGQKQVPRFCTRTRSMVLPQMGQGSHPLCATLKSKWAVPSSPFVTCYLFQTLPDIQHEFKGHCIQRLGFQRYVFTDVFSNAFTLYQLFRICFSFLVCVAEYS